MKCQYFVAFILITICSRIVSLNFLYDKRKKRSRGILMEKKRTKEFILAIVFPEIHSVIVFFISLFDEMSIFCCFYTHNYMFPNSFIEFSLWKRKKRLRGIQCNQGIHPSYRISRDTLCYSVLHFIIR